jgi:hypothetical protein
MPLLATDRVKCRLKNVYTMAIDRVDNVDNVARASRNGNSVLPLRLPADSPPATARGQRHGVCTLQTLMRPRQRAAKRRRRR